MPLDRDRSSPSEVEDAPSRVSIEPTEARRAGLTETLLNHLQAGVVAANRHGFITYANLRALETLGLSPVQCLGRALHEVFGSPDVLIRGLESLGAGLECRFDFAVQVRGQRLDIGMTCFRPGDQSSADTSTVAVFRDLAERRQFELELRRLERLSALGHVVAGFAHEVRNPLAAIQGLAENLICEMSPSDARRELVLRILTALGRIERFVKGSLDYGDPRPPQRAHHTPGSLVAAAVRALALRTMVAPVPVTVERDLPFVDVDAGQIVEALLALLDNALDAGGGAEAVRVHVGLATAEETAPNDRSHVCIEVVDAGPGIPEENLPRVFDPFFTTKVAGTGLGLAIVQTLARQNGGRIRVRSSPGAGTRAALVLPGVSS